MTPEIDLLKQRVESLEMQLACAFSVIGTFIPSVGQQLSGSLEQHRHVCSRLDGELKQAMLIGEGPKAWIRRIHGHRMAWMSPQDIPYKLGDEAQAKNTRWFGDYFMSQFNLLDSSKLPSIEDLVELHFTPNEMYEVKTGCYKTRTQDYRHVFTHVFVLRVDEAPNTVIYVLYPGDRNIQGYVYIPVEMTWVKVDPSFYMTQESFNGAAMDALASVGIPLLTVGVTRNDLVDMIMGYDISAHFGQPALSPARALVVQDNSERVRWIKFDQMVPETDESGNQLYFDDGIARYVCSSHTRLDITIGGLRISFVTTTKTISFTQIVYARENPIVWEDISKNDQVRVAVAIKKIFADHAPVVTEAVEE